MSPVVSPAMRFRYVAVVLALLVTAGCAAAPLGAASAQEENPKTGTVTVSGSGEASAAPDTATVYFAVTATDDSADSARETVATGSEAVRTALSAAGFGEPRTVGYSLAPVYEGRYDERSITGYRVAHRFAVDAAPDRAGELVDVVTGAGANEVSGVSFGLSDDARDELRAEALRDAMARAEADANTVADAANGSLGAVTDVSTGYAPVYPSYERGVGGAADAATVVTPGDVRVSASVTVTYELN
jgi:uncharacterized protein YggE